MTKDLIPKFEIKYAKNILNISDNDKQEIIKNLKEQDWGEIITLIMRMGSDFDTQTLRFSKGAMIEKAVANLLSGKRVDRQGCDIEAEVAGYKLSVECKFEKTTKKTKITRALSNPNGNRPLNSNGFIEHEFHSDIILMMSPSEFYVVFSKDIDSTHLIFKPAQNILDLNKNNSICYKIADFSQDDLNHIQKHSSVEGEQSFRQRYDGLCEDELEQCKIARRRMQRRGYAHRYTRNSVRKRS